MARHCDHCKPDLCLFAGGGSGGGGGGGGGGGFTLLHGTYSVVEEVEYVTLPIAASALYALMQTSCVAFDYTTIDEGYSMNTMAHLTTAKVVHPEDDADAYMFSGYVMTTLWETNWIEDTDAVLFPLTK